MKSTIKNVAIWEQSIFSDDRGTLLELFRNDMLNKEHFPAMAYISSTNPGVMRGPHRHFTQTDIFVFLGDFRLYLVEDQYYRSGGSSDPYYFGEEFDMKYGCGVIVPPGIIHAYRNTGNEVGLVFNAPNRLYAGPGKRYSVDEERLEEDEAFMKIFRKTFTLPETEV